MYRVVRIRKSGPSPPYPAPSQEYCRRQADVNPVEGGEGMGPVPTKGRHPASCDKRGDK